MISHSPLPHFLGAVTLLGVSRHLSDPGAAVAALAAFGLTCSGLSQLLKVGLDIFRVRRGLVRELAALKSQGPAVCPYGRAEREACAARPKPDRPLLPIPGRLPDGKPTPLGDGRGIEL